MMFGFAARLIGGMVSPLIDQLSASSTRLLKKLALFLAAAVAMVVVLIALTVAFDLWIGSLAGPIAGALAVAGVYFVIAAVCVLLALRRPKPGAADARSGANAEATSPRTKNGPEPEAPDPVDAFAAPLLAVLQSLGLRREQLAVLAGTSLAKQLGPIPLVGVAIVAGFIVGRMWTGWRSLLSNDLVTALLSSELLAGLFGGGRSDRNDEDGGAEKAETPP